MTLLHPWALLGGLAVAIPLAVHWLTRPKPVRLPLSTIRFVMEAVHQRRARHRLRDFLLLALRVIAVALLAAAFARPLIGAKPLISSEPTADVTRVIVIDQSQSMAAVSNGIAAFERARSVAARFLSWARGVRGNVILSAARPRPLVDRLTTNVAALREGLAAAKPLPQRLDVAAAINRASELLAAGPPGQPRELVIVSDFQRSNWTSADFSPLPKETRIQLESVAPPQTPANLAILRVVPSGIARQGRELNVDVEIGNYSPSPRDLQVDVALGRATCRLHGLCPPGVKTILSGEIVPSDVGWQAGEARLLGVEDALSVDNARSFALEVRPAAVFALVTREPAKPQPTSSHFLERALCPALPRGGEADTGGRVKRIDPTALDHDAIGGRDLIVIDHPGKLSQSAVGLLAALLRHGRPVLYVAAESIDATNLKLISTAAGADLRMPVEFAPPPAGDIRRDLFLADVRRSEAPFAAFGESLPAAIGPLRFGGGLASRRIPGGLAEDVLATYSDRSACLVSEPCGAGTLAVFNVDLNASNLVGSPAFVPLVAELVTRLLGAGRSETAVASGEPLAAYLPVDAGPAAGLKTVGPAGGSEDIGSISDEGNFVIWRSAAAGPPGVYTIKRDAATVFALATAVPDQEADLTPIDPSVLKDRLAGERSVAFQAATEDAERRDNLWAWVLVACAGCMLLEVAALRAFRT